MKPGTVKRGEFGQNVNKSANVPVASICSVSDKIINAEKIILKIHLQALINKLRFRSIR
jgi:hypothetical protein